MSILLLVVMIEVEQNKLLHWKAEVMEGKEISWKRGPGFEFS